MWVVARIPHFYFTHIPFRPTYLTSNLLLSVPIYVGGGGGLGLLTLAKYVGGMCPVLVQKISVKCIWTQTFNVEAILTVTPWRDNTSFPWWRGWRNHDLPVCKQCFWHPEVNYPMLYTISWEIKHPSFVVPTIPQTVGFWLLWTSKYLCCLCLL